MNLKKTLLATAVTSLLVGLSMPTQACFTVIVGKDASSTGSVMIGHNEDNDRRIITNQYWVPAATHKAGEMIEFEAAAAKIPQVEKTFGFWWTQTLAPDGYSFSDGFMNENGVVVATNNCNITHEKDEKVNDGGIGYGIRRLVAERATSARHGVDIVIELMEKYGYFHQGRTYTIADKNEAWQIGLLRGHRYLARRVADNEIAFMANAFSLDKVDLNDKENVIASPDLVEHAIKMGYYKPAKAGDYSDFSFREAYQPEARRIFPRNKERVFTILERLTGKEYKDVNDYPMGLITRKKFTAQDVQKLISGHSKFEKRESGWFHETMNDICNSGTFDSVVYELDQNPYLTTAWRAAGRPMEQVYTPSFPLAKPALAQSYMDPATGTHAQFHATAEQLSFSPDRSIYQFLVLQNHLDWMPEAMDDFKDVKKEYEREYVEKLAKAKKVASSLWSIDQERALDYMHQFNVVSFENALNVAVSFVADLQMPTLVIHADRLSVSKTSDVKVTLVGNGKVDLRKIDLKKTYMGSPYPNEGLELNRKMAQPVDMKVVDTNNDGIADVELTFKSDGVTAYGFPGVKSEIYLFTEADGRRLVSYDTVMLTK